MFVETQCHSEVLEGLRLQNSCFRMAKIPANWMNSGRDA